MAELPEVCLRTQHRVDGAVIGGIVAVVRGGFKNRIEVKDGDAHSRQLRQAGGNAGQ